MFRHYKNFFSLHSTVGILVILIAGGFSLYIFDLKSLDRNIKILVDKNLIEKNERITELAGKIVKKQIETVLKIGLIYAKNQDIIELINQGKWEQAALTASPIIKDSNEFVERIGFTDLPGNFKSDFPTIPNVRGQNFGHRDWYKGVTKYREPYLSVVYKRTAKPQFNVITIALPISKDTLNRTLGFLVLQIRLEKFQELVESIDIGSGNSLFIVDQKGKIVSYPGISLQEKIIDYSRQTDVKAVISGENGSEIVMIGRKHYLSSYKTVQPFGWGVLLRTLLK